MAVTILIVAAVLIALKFILFPIVREIPVTGKYQITSEDYWATLDTRYSCKRELISLAESSFSTIIAITAARVSI